MNRSQYKLKITNINTVQFYFYKMLFLYYFIINRATLANFLVSNFNYSIIRTNSDTENHEIYEKHNQLDASERTLQDSIELYEGENNPIVGKKIIKKNNKIYSGNNKNLYMENLENRDENLNVNSVFIKKTMTRSLDKKKFKNGDKIKAKRSIKDRYMPTNENKDEKDILLESTNGVINHKIKTLIDNTTPDDSIIRDLTAEIVPKNAENYKKEATKPSFFNKKHWLNRLFKINVNDYLSMFSNLKENFDDIKSTEHTENKLIFHAKGINNLEASSIFLDLDFILKEMELQIKKDKPFYGFETLCRYISKFLEKDSGLDNEIICESIPRIYEYFLTFYDKILDLNENMKSLLDNFYNKLEQYEEYDINFNHSKEIDKLIRNLEGIKITIEEKFKEVYIKKNQIRNSICDSYKNQYGIGNDNFNVPNICLERYVCALELDFYNPLYVKDGVVKIKNAREDVSDCLNKVENQQNNQLISYNKEEYRNNTNFESIIKYCVSKNFKRNIPIGSSTSMYNEILSSVLLFNMNEFDYIDLTFLEIVINNRIEELILRLGIFKMKYAEKITSSK